MTFLRTVAFAGAVALFGNLAIAQEAPTLDGQALPAYEPGSGGLIAEIKARGKLINGVEAAVPPFEYIDKGEIVGFDIDLARMFAESLGVELEVIDTAWAGVVASLYSKKFDMIWSALPITDARLKAMNFSQVYATDQPVFLVTADNTEIKGLADFKGKVLGTQLNTSIEEQSKMLSEKENLGLDIKLYDHIDAAYLDLANGNLDIVTTAITGFSELEKKVPGKYKIVYQLPPNLLMAVGMRKQDPDLLAAVDEFLTKIRASGELVALQKKWFGFEMELPK